MFKEVPFVFEGLPVYLALAGQGPFVVVVPGGPGLSSEYIAPWLEPLFSSFQVVVYDPTGCGRSVPLPEGQRYAVERENRLLAAILAWCKERESATPLYLLGHSFGGLQVAGLLGQTPQLSRDVEKAVLVASVPLVKERGENFLLSQLLRIPPVYKKRYLSLYRSRRKRPLTDEEQLLMVRIGLMGGLCEPERVEELTLSYNPLLYEHFNEARSSYDLRAGARDVEIPILVIAGRHDFLPVESQRAIASAFPHATLEIMEEVSHYPFFEDPETFTSHIRRFLEA